MQALPDETFYFNSQQMLIKCLIAVQVTLTTRRYVFRKQTAFTDLITRIEVLCYSTEQFSKEIYASAEVVHTVSLENRGEFLYS